MNRRLAVVAVVVGVLTASVSLASASQLMVRSTSLTTVTATVPQPPSLGLANYNGGATAGRAENDDIVVVSFPQALDAPSMCSTWTNAATSQSITANNAVTVTITNGGTANDTLTVATSCTGWSFGTVDLGGTGFVTANASFRGNTTSSRSTVSYDPGTRLLMVTLGARVSGTVGTVSTSRTATFTPSAALLWQDGNTVSPSTGTSTGVQF